MSIHYPAGVVPPSNERKTVKSGAKKHGNIASAANRGMVLENELNDANLYYREKDLAIIYKRPTPINIVKVDYEKGATITQAYFETASTTDYNGIYKGHYLDFEAKSTKSKTSLPLNNIAAQQVDHLEAVARHGGIAFFIISIDPLNEVYLIDARFICEFYRDKPRKSIPVSTIKEHGYLVKEGYHPRLDFLPLIDALFLKNEQ